MPFPKPLPIPHKLVGITKTKKGNPKPKRSRVAGPKFERRSITELPVVPQDDLDPYQPLERPRTLFPSYGSAVKISSNPVVYDRIEKDDSQSESDSDSDSETETTAAFSNTAYRDPSRKKTVEKNKPYQQSESNMDVDMGPSDSKCSAGAGLQTTGVVGTIAKKDPWGDVLTGEVVTTKLEAVNAMGSAKVRRGPESYCYKRELMKKPSGADTELTLNKGDGIQKT